MRDLIAALHQLRRSHGPGAATARLRLIERGRIGRSADARRLVAWHDELLYAAAYPDNPAVLHAAEEALRLLARRPASRVAALVNSGVAGTKVEGGFTPDLLRWMMDRPGQQPEPVWGADTADRFEKLLPLLLLPAEQDAILSPELTTRQLWELAAGRHPIAWLLDRLDQVATDPAHRESLAAELDLTVRWRLGAVSRTLTRFPPRPPFYQEGPLLRHQVLGQVLAQSLPRPRSLPGHGAVHLIDIARAALAARARETDPVTFATSDEVDLFRLDRGVDVALFGLAPAHRLPIESYFGFVAARNRIPIAYGGGWVFFGRCEIGVNLFPEFRGGESAVIFAQVLRAYRQRYNLTQFLVDPYQFGRNNPEAIRSGAFWFYYRLGFRPTDPQIAGLATAEMARLHAQPGHLTPASLLRRFADAPLFLDIAPIEAGKVPAPDTVWHPVAPDLSALSLAASHWIAQQLHSDRQAVAQWAPGAVRRALGRRVTVPRRGFEREWFERLAPLVAMIPDLARWPVAERRLLAATLAAKGGRRERDYALRLQRLPRLLQAWQQAAARPLPAPA